MLGKEQLWVESEFDPKFLKKNAYYAVSVFNWAGRRKFHLRIKKKTRPLKSFPWDALIYGSIMAFYLG